MINTDKRGVFLNTTKKTEQIITTLFFIVIMSVCFYVAIYMEPNACIVLVGTVLVSLSTALFMNLVLFR